MSGPLTKLRHAGAHTLARLAAARVRRRAAGLPRSAGADEVADFLFSPAARAIEAWQIPDEFRALARLVERRRPRTVLEIGTADGGTLFAHTRLAHEEALVLSLDLPEGPFGGGYPAWRIPLYRSFAGPRQKLVLLRADSHAPATATAIEDALGGRRLDYAFIDGDHTYDGVRQDFELCLRFAAPDAVIAFHDIARPSSAWLADQQLPPTDGAVHRFWMEVRERYAHDEFIHDAAQEGYGIGVLHLGATAGNAGDTTRSEA
jgi:predicted O-methyltransferase YrrM